MAKIIPPKKMPRGRQIGLRATLLEQKILDLAAEIDARQRDVAYVSRNNFVLRASLEAAKILIRADGQKVPGE